ncbi:UspA domain-containing protein [Actinobacteria bacterium OK074]|nr:UspA domain-containing protein [Actinobacteria bacterium OK074]
MVRPVVVGLDGSRESLAAADWAAGEALRRGAPLRLVHAWEAASPEPSTLPELDAPRYWARRILREAVERLGERRPQVRPDVEQIAKSPADALVSAGAEAGLLVLGSRAFSGFGGFFAGSVALATVARAVRPVVLVRADATPESERVPGADGLPSAHAPYRPVVVGVDTEQQCEEVLAFAFESAVLRSAPLRVVHAWRPPLALGPGPETAPLREAAERELDTVLGPWREKYPAVEVDRRVEHGRTAQSLLDAAADSCLLVVGRRIRTAGFGTHTGPVAHAVMHHVRCPIAVVPHG